MLLQSGDAETLRLWKILVGLSAAYFNTVYDTLGVLLTDDDLVGESYYQPLMPGVVDRLAAAGLLEESDGADVVFPPGFENRDGDPLPLIIQKGTGGFNYATSDLACVIDRTERIGADLILYVVDAGQSQHFQMVFAVAHMAGWLDDETEAVHVPFGIVLGIDRKRLKTRSGEPVRLVALLDEAIARADAAIAEKNPDLDAATRQDVARSIGIGAVKYADLSTDRIKDYVFDFDRMLAFEGNTGPYLQYAHARICSIFRREGVERTSVRTSAIELVEPQELELAQQTPRVPVGCRRGARVVQPPQALHLRVRRGDRVQRVLRTLSDQGFARAHLFEPTRIGRSHGSGARTSAGPARDRRAGADVTVLT